MAYNFNLDYDFYITKNYAAMTSANTVKINASNFSFDKNFNIENIYRKTLDGTGPRGVESYLNSISAVNWTLETYIYPVLDTNITSPEEFLWESLVGAAPTSTPSSSVFDFADGNVAELSSISFIIAPRQVTNKVWVITGVIERLTIDISINNLVMLKWKGLGTISQDIVEGAVPSISNYTDRTNLLPYIPGKFTTVSLTKYTSGGDHAYTLPIISGNLEITNKVQTYSTPKIGETSTITGHWVEERVIEGNLKAYLKSGSGNTEFLVKDILTEWANGFENGDISINLNGYNDELININLPLVKFDHANQNLDDVVTTTFKFIAQETTGNYVTITYSL